MLTCHDSMLDKKGDHNLREKVTLHLNWEFVMDQIRQKVTVQLNLEFGMFMYNSKAESNSTT